MILGLSTMQRLMTIKLFGETLMRTEARWSSRALHRCREDTHIRDLLQSGLTVPRDTGALVEDGCCQGAGQGGCGF